MILISDNLSTKDPEVKKAVETKNADYLNDIAQRAKDKCFEYLEILAEDTDDEVEALLFIIDSTKDAGLKYVIRSANVSTLEAVAPKAPQPGILALTKVTSENADALFNLKMSLNEEWGILFTQTYGDDSLSAEVEGMIQLIGKAEQIGVLPEFLFIEPLSISIATNNNSYMKMKRMIDAFRNMYPDINFYLYLPEITEGLVDQVTLVNVFIAIADLLGVNAYSFNIDHDSHIQTLSAVNAILNKNDQTIESYLKNFKN